MHETWVRSLILEDPTSLGVTKPVCHNYWAPALESGSRDSALTAYCQRIHNSQDSGVVRHTSGQYLRWQSLPGTNTAFVQPWGWRPPEILNCVYSGHAHLRAHAHTHTHTHIHTLTGPAFPKPIWWQIYEVRHPTKLPLIQKYALPWASLVAQSVKNLPAMQETWVRSLGWEDPLEKEMATGGLQTMESQRVGHNWATNTYSLMLCL